jgi:class 3 adenylate cyclase/tetratricopeptide (TPR) repeat protein
MEGPSRNDAEPRDRNGVTVVVDSFDAGNRVEAKRCSVYDTPALDGGSFSSSQQTTAAAVVSEPAIDISAERRQLTVVICDLVDSTTLATRLDPEDLRELVDTCLHCVIDAVRRFGGIVSQFIGDGALAYFGYPIAHEDDVERAILAGLQIIEEMHRLPLFEGYKPRIRIGIATGLVVVGKTGRAGRFEPYQDVVGVTPNLAARLQAIAGPNEIVIAPITHKLAGDLFDCRDLGSVVLKGFEEPVRAWRVLGRRIVESPFDARHEASISPLVGRREELALLLRRWYQVLGGGGRVVLIEGEPGIGKSRIRRALQEQLANQQLLVMSFYCSQQDSNSPFYPIISRMEQWAGFTHSDTVEQKFTKLEAFFRQSTSDPEPVALVAELLSLPSQQSALPDLSPEQRKERTMEALLAPLVNLSERRPLLVVFEDLHWVDPSTLEVLGRLLELVARLRVLLVMTARPDFASPWPSYAHMTTIALSRLNRCETAALAKSVASGKQLPNAVLDQVLARTDGVPLFVEELTKALLESGVSPERESICVAERAVPHATVPATLHDSLMARLDRIGGLREIAQVGAAIGREFSSEMLREVSGLPALKIEEALEQLLQAQLITRRGEVPNASYTFRHSLICDAAYSTLLRPQRHRVHARIVAVIKKRFPSLVEQQPELLGLHCTEAGLTEEAVGYWGKAGRQSAARHAKIEAVVHFRRALALLASVPHLPDRLRQELELESALARALMAGRNGAEEAGQSYRRARKLCEELGDAAALVPVLGGLVMVHLGRCELSLARQTAEDLFRLGERQNDLAACFAGRFFRGVCLYWVGEFVLAKDELEQTLDFPTPAADLSSAAVAAWDMRIAAQCFLSLTLLVLGHADQALSRSRLAVAQSRALRPPQILARELTYAGLFNLLRRAEDEALVLAEEAISIATDRRYPFWLEVACIIRGFALAARGNAVEGLRLAREAAAERERAGSVGGQTFFLGLLAELCERTNRPDEAWEALRTASELVEATGERWFEPEVHRMRGEWLLAHRRHEQDQAEASFRRAHVLARQQGAKLWELRAATSLGRLWLSQGKRSDAYALLTPTYGLFTEGFNTPDLTEAKTLIDALSCPGEGQKSLLRHASVSQVQKAALSED